MCRLRSSAAGSPGVDGHQRALTVERDRGQRIARSEVAAADVPRGTSPSGRPAQLRGTPLDHAEMRPSRPLAEQAGGPAAAALAARLVVLVAGGSLTSASPPTSHNGAATPDEHRRGREAPRRDHLELPAGPGQIADVAGDHLGPLVHPERAPPHGATDRHGSPVARPASAGHPAGASRSRGRADPPPEPRSTTVAPVGIRIDEPLGVSDGGLVQRSAHRWPHGPGYRRGHGAGPRRHRRRAAHSPRRVVGEPVSRRPGR